MNKLTIMLVVSMLIACGSNEPNTAKKAQVTHQNLAKEVMSAMIKGNLIKQSCKNVLSELSAHKLNTDPKKKMSIDSYALVKGLFFLMLPKELDAQQKLSQYKIVTQTLEQVGPICENDPSLSLSQAISKQMKIINS